MIESGHEDGTGGVLADRVDGEPPAILGLSTTEVMIVALAVGLVCLPLLLLLALLFGLVRLALGATGFVFLGGLWVGSIIFRRLKRGRPLGYYQVRLAIALQRAFGGRRFVLRSGAWDIGRSALPSVRTPKA